MPDQRPADFYTGLVAELYAPLRSEVAPVEPYARFVERWGEPALELGCGHGEPLLDLRRLGLDVEGLDSSADMLALARAAAARDGLDVVLHHAAIETMDLGRRYRSIFLAGATFNLLVDDETAVAALRRIAVHLEPDGAALVPLFVPSPTPPEWIGPLRSVGDEHGRVMRCGVIGETRDEEARTQTSVLRYELDDGGATTVVERPWVLHWHTRDGFRRLADEAGLRVRSEHELGPDEWSAVLVPSSPSPA